MTQKGNMGITSKPIDFKQNKQDHQESVSKAARETAQYLPGRIVGRTQKGKSYTGASFKRYSDSYAAYKMRTEGDTTVDLWETGNMLNSITAKTVRKSNYVQIEVSLSSGQAKKAGHVEKLRKFFGFSKEDKKFIFKNVVEILRRGRK